jgi:hypothetical protein
MLEINEALPRPKPWNGARGVPSGEPRPEPVQQQQRQLTQAENAVATHLGVSGLPLESAARLAVIIIELRSQVEYLQQRVRELMGE